MRDSKMCLFCSGFDMDDSVCLCFDSDYYEKEVEEDFTCLLNDMETN